MMETEKENYEGTVHLPDTHTHTHNTAVWNLSMKASVCFFDITHTTCWVLQEEGEVSLENNKCEGSHHCTITQRLTPVLKNKLEMTPKWRRR